MTSLVLLILPTIACGFRLEASGKETSSNLKAASNLINCGCQCSSLTFVDSAGQVQGNCRTVDSTGARWCYTSHGSTCQDLTTSTHFPSNPWSYEACATPPLGSYQCPNNIVAPSLVAHPFLPPATRWSRRRTLTIPSCTSPTLAMFRVTRAQVQSSTASIQTTSQLEGFSIQTRSTSPLESALTRTTWPQAGARNIRGMRF